MSSVHISGDGVSMKLWQVRQFVEATQKWPPNTTLQAGVIGLARHGLSIAYETLQGLEAHT